MWCSRVHKLLSAHVDGELSPADVSRVEEHLASCERCSQEHTHFRRLGTLTSLVPDEDLPSGLQARILANLASAASTSAPVHRVAARRVGGGLFAPWTPFAVAGMAAAAVVGYVIANPQLERGAQLASNTPEVSQPREVVEPGTAPAPSVTVPVEPQAPVEAEIPSEAPSETPTPPVTAREQEPVERPERRMAAREERREEAVASPRERAVADAGSSRKEASEARNTGFVVTVGKGERRAPRLQPDMLASVIPTKEKRSVDTGPATAVALPQNAMPMPAEPMTVAATEATQPQPVVTGMESDSTTRMAGGTMEGAMPIQDEDGLNALRTYLQERNQAVPQPTLLPNPQRRMRKL